MSELRKKIVEELNTLYEYPTTLVQLNETTLNRIMGYHVQNGFITISANRDERDPSENNKKFKELKKDVISHGYSYLPIYGGYVENLGTDKATDVVEQGLLITNDNSNDPESYFQNLISLGKSLSKKYDQESFMVKEPGKTHEAYWMTPDGTIENRYTAVKINDYTQQYFTQLSKNRKRFDPSNVNDKVDRRFTYYIPKEPGGVQEAKHRYGERFYNLNLL